MAENKKGFILYADNQTLVNKLPDELAGRLFKHIFAYVNDENPKINDLLLDIAFEPIKMQLKRDLKKYEQTKEKRSEAGKKSAEVKKQNSTKSTSVKSVEQTSTKSTDSVTVNVTDIEINKLIYNELLISESWLELNAKVNKISVEKTKKYLIRFNDVLNTQQDKKNNKTEFTSHFARWLPIEIEKDKKLIPDRQPLKF